MGDLTEQLAAIKARAMMATSGPWGSGKYSPVRRLGDGREVVWLDIDTSSPGPPSYDVGISEEDAEFIAHSREDVPRLLAAVEASQKHKLGQLTWHEDQGIWVGECRCLRYRSTAYDPMFAMFGQETHRTEMVERALAGEPGA